MSSLSPAEPLLQTEKPGLNDGGVRCKLLVSHAITRLGTQGWMFVAPLVLVRYTSNSILGPATYGMVTMLTSSFLGAPLGTWADRSSRKKVISIGVILQFIAVACSTTVILLMPPTVMQDGEGFGTKNLLAVAVFTAFGVVEKLGTMLSDVSVKREWTPQLFADDTLRSMNTKMSQIDLTTEVIGPFIAGLLISAGSVNSIADELPHVGSPENFGFVATGILNALSFWPQLWLLLSIYRTHAHLLQPVPAEKLKTRSGPVPQEGAWTTWFQHTGGLQFLSLSYALLYLTVLSPHGALLTAYLQVKEVPSWQLSLLRGAGAFTGVFGATLQPALNRCCGRRQADALSVTWLAVWMFVALVAFYYAGNATGVTTPVFMFMAAVCLGRPGLYSFELGVMNEEQELVDKRCRAAIGAVDTALTSLATVVMYGSGMVLNETSQFGILVTGSAVFVGLGAVTYWLWCCLYKIKKHRHAEDQHAHGEGHGHTHLHGDVDHEHHDHTLQMEEALQNGWHEHVTYDPSTCSVQ
eukprot:TRINITY_DN110096_c0_g1_i1.p1 TRINITY_DN110096_c0_g1~~TRINITY_DN110096_c0_g1_i1.p1  ORF type:complete len:524 (-),score=76.96 TRINITY_DN110096_c0_g1_i1:347-1918(-)